MEPTGNINIDGGVEWWRSGGAHWVGSSGWGGGSVMGAAGSVGVEGLMEAGW